MSCFIGIDIGGTYLKAARLWPKDDRIADVVSIPTPETLPEILEAVKREIEFLGKGAAGILITGQMGSYVVDGKFYSWKLDKTLDQIYGKHPHEIHTLLDYIAAQISENYLYHYSHCTLLDMGDTEIVPVGRFGDMSIYTPVGDHQCSLFGAGLQNCELSVNLGTGGQVSILGGTDRPYFDARGLTCKVRLPAGRALSALQKLLNRSWLELENAAEKVECEMDAHFTLYPGPCGAYGWFKNLSEKEMTHGHFYRAALESIARNVENCTVGMPRFDAVRLSGGMFARSPLLRNLVAERFPGKRIEWNAERAGVEALYGLMELAKGIA